MSDFELENNVDGINWQTLADYCVTGRTAEECKIHWINQTKINKEKWTKPEELKLLQLSTEEKSRNWGKISEKLGTNRQPYQCLVRYQRSLNKDILRSEWSDADTRQLIKAVETYGTKNWQQIANTLDRRTGQQCLHKWRDATNPDIKRGLWTTLEDRRLTLALKAYGNRKWVKIQRHIPGRTDVQCRERWVNVVNPALSNEQWTKEEDLKLQDAVKTFGIGKWSAIAKAVYPRTDNQCWRRWQSLNSKAFDEYRTRQRKRVQLIRNFAGRAKERSSLTQEDLSLVTESDERPRKRPKYDNVPALKTPHVTIDLDLLDPIPESEKENTPSGLEVMSSFPLVMPSPVTYRVFANLLLDLEKLDIEYMSPIPLSLAHSIQFKILASWFSGLFLFPSLIFNNNGFLDQNQITLEEDECSSFNDSEVMDVVGDVSGEDIFKKKENFKNFMKKDGGVKKNGRKDGKFIDVDDDDEDQDVVGDVSSDDLKKKEKFRNFVKKDGGVTKNGSKDGKFIDVDDDDQDVVGDVSSDDLKKKKKFRNFLERDGEVTKNGIKDDDQDDEDDEFDVL